MIDHKSLNSFLYQDYRVSINRVIADDCEYLIFHRFYALNRHGATAATRGLRLSRKYLVIVDN